MNWIKFIDELPPTETTIIARKYSGAYFIGKYVNDVTTNFAPKFLTTDSVFGHKSYIHLNEFTCWCKIEEPEIMSMQIKIQNAYFKSSFFKYRIPISAVMLGIGDHQALLDELMELKRELHVRVDGKISNQIHVFDRLVTVYRVNDFDGIGFIEQGEG